MRKRKIGLLAAFILAGCGGGGGNSQSASTPTPTPTPTPTLQQRIDAAQSTATSNAACSSITPFYWEIGDVNGVLASGTGGNNSTTAPNSATVMEIASASKWLFGTYALQRSGYASIQSAGNIGYLNFTSGFDNMGTLTCGLTDTVSACFNAVSTKGGHNSDFHSADVGKFYYDGGHLQAYATNIAGLGGYYDSNTGNQPQLAVEIQAQLGQDIALQYQNPGLAGGAKTSAADYARFLRKILNGTLTISNYLNANAVCAWTNLGDCNALYSPINQSAAGPNNDVSNEKWHYSLAHWIEDDPGVGDGSYSSPGAFGFYPWIDKTKTYYGILARYDAAGIMPTDPTKAPYITSVNCGRTLRKAWLAGVAQ